MIQFFVNMLNYRLFSLIHDKRLSVPFLRSFHHEFSQPEPKKSLNGKVGNQKADELEAINSQTDNLTGALKKKYNIFREEESPEILDIYEERQRYQSQDEQEELMGDDSYAGLNLKRE